MQRIKALIDKLNIQFEQKAPPTDMLSTLQLLQREITGGLKESEMLGHSNVSVFIPNMPSIRYPKNTENVKDDEKVYFELSETEATDEEIDELLLQNSLMEAEKKAKEQETLNEGGKGSRQTEMLFENEENSAINEVPTFAQYAKKVDDPKSQPVGKEEKNQPVKHLKKAISQMDRQMFLQDLFRGDENMYERSIKTIDNFQAYPEAEFWIRRELKTKLGWLPDHPTVDHFDRLVKRRFA